MRRLRIPATLALVPVLAAGCSPMPGNDAAADVVADTAVEASGDTGGDGGDGGAPVCRYDPMRPASDPCERANLDGGLCVFNIEADGGITCMYIAA